MDWRLLFNFFVMLTTLVLLMLLFGLNDAKAQDNDMSLPEYLVSRQLQIETCGPRFSIEGTLKHKYSESMVQEGEIPGTPFIAQLWVNSNTGTWTVITTHGELTCVVASGQDRSYINKELEG